LAMETFSQKCIQTLLLNHVRVVGNPKTERRYLLDFVKPLIESLFDVAVGVYTNKKGNEIFLTAYGKNLVRFLDSVGLPCGNKIRNRASIPSWIFEDERYLKACIRGLIDTDGSIYVLKPHYPNLLQICFKSKNPRLLADFKIALQKLGFHPSRISWDKVYLTRQSEIERYAKEIGFSNQNHLERYCKVRMTLPYKRAI